MENSKIAKRYVGLKNIFDSYLKDTEYTNAMCKNKGAFDMYQSVKRFVLKISQFDR